MRTGALFGVVAVVAGLMTLAPGRAQAQAAEPARPEAAPSAKIPAVLPPDVVFGRFVALIRGHLLTGDELVRQRDWNDAHRHFMFPLEEIYGVIREYLPAHKTPPFDGALKALARTVAAHNVKQYPKALEKVEDALAAAEADLKSRHPDWPTFVVAIAVTVLKTASDEYDDAVANDRVVHPVGYRTARGFILQADRMIEGVAIDLAVKNPEALLDIRKGFTQLKQAFTAVAAPKRPPIDPGTMRSITSRIDLATKKLERPSRPNNP
jgi:hypothetical protein